MEKPYLEKKGEVGDFSIFVVDGLFIRTNIDEEFTNFGQHFRFKFIPKNEFWIDKENSGDESRFFVDHMLEENHLMSLGIKYGKAIEIADKKEKKERSKSKFYKADIKLKKKHDPKLIERIHKRKIIDLEKEISVWVVNGEIVRDLFFIDFTEGGHDKVYSFVPKNEVWIDDDVSPKERKFVILHEIHERNLMSKGFSYDKAHISSSAIEYRCRKKPSIISQIIKQEIKKIK